MFCQRCGAALPDDSRFCTNCGATLAPPQPQALPQPQPRYAPPQYAPPQYAQPTYAPQAVGDVRAYVARSALFMITAITVSVQTLFSLLSVILSIGNSLFYGFGMRPAYVAVNAIRNLIPVIINVLFTVAVWKLFAAARKGGGAAMDRALGFAMAIVIVKFAEAMLMPVIEIVLSRLFGFYSIAGMGFILLSMLIAPLLYVTAILCVRLIKSGRTNALVIILAIVCFVFAGYTFIMQIVNLVQLGVTVYMMITRVSSVTAAAATLLFGILLLKYNSAAKAVGR